MGNGRGTLLLDKCYLKLSQRFTKPLFLILGTMLHSVHLVAEQAHPRTAYLRTLPDNPVLDSRNRRVDPSKAEQRIESIRSGLIPGSQSLNLSLGIPARSDGLLGGVAHVDELVADAVRDDVGVQRLLLALGHESVLRDEGELVGGTAGEAADAGDGGLAYAKVKVASTDIGAVVGTVIDNLFGGTVIDNLFGVVLLLVDNVASIGVTRLGPLASLGRLSRLATTGATLQALRLSDLDDICSSVILDDICSCVILDDICSCVILDDIASTGATATGSSTVLTRKHNVRTRAIHGSEAREALLNHNLGLGQTVRGEGRGDGLLRRRVGDLGAIHGRVNLGRDAAQLLVHRQGGIGADEGDAHCEGVEVGLGGDETDGCGNDGVIRSELIDDLVRDDELSQSSLASQARWFFESGLVSYLLTGTRSREEGRGDGPSNSGSDARIAETGSAEILDGLNGFLFLAESSLGNGQEDGQRNRLGERHVVSLRDMK